jgi:hemerythrin-like domain-containing protein
MNHHMAEDPTKSGLKRQINENLKRVYEDALKEDIPDRFKQLLEDLKKKESGE